MLLHHQGQLTPHCVWVLSQSLSLVWLSATPRTVARQAPLSTGKNTGAGCHALLQGISLTWWSNLHSLSLLHWQEDSLPLSHLGSSSSCAAAAAKSLQSCPTLCDPIDGSPPGSPVPGILQARTLCSLIFMLEEQPAGPTLRSIGKWHLFVADSMKGDGFKKKKKGDGFYLHTNIPGKEKSTPQRQRLLQCCGS